MRKYQHERGPGEDAWVRQHTFSVQPNGTTFRGGGAYLEAMREADYQRRLGREVYVRDDATGERCG